MSQNRPIIIATRGSALALAQSNMILAECREKFPDLQFELKIIKTTGDKMQSASMARIDATLPRGLFTKELEVALLNREADFAVHSLKDLPTELPAGLKLGATTKREDVRDVLIYRSEEHLEKTKGTSHLSKAGMRGFQSKLKIKDFPNGATVGTSSTRRKAQLLSLRPDLKIVEIRGNVGTRLEKLAQNPELDATILAAAGLKRLNFEIGSNSELKGENVPAGIFATPIGLDEMLPCVGQAAIGIESREDDERIAAICGKLNHVETFQAVTAERAFLRGLGGGCQSAVAAHAEVAGGNVQLKTISFLKETPQRAEGKRTATEAVVLGEELAKVLNK